MQFLPLNMEKKDIDMLGLPKEVVKKLKENHNLLPKWDNLHKSINSDLLSASLYASDSNSQSSPAPQSSRNAFKKEFSSVPPRIKVKRSRASEDSDSVCSSPEASVKEHIATQAIAPFIQKLLDFVNDPQTDQVISWCDDGKAFEVNEPDNFSNSLLPQYFKHKNIASFIRQLNLYGFTKKPNLKQGVLMPEAGSDKLKFFHPNFQKDHPELLSQVSRNIKKDTGKGNKKQLEVTHVLSELNFVKDQQVRLVDQLREMQVMNDKLWKANQEARLQNKLQQDTINKILHFLGTLFSPDKPSEKLPVRHRLLLNQPATDEISNSTPNPPPPPVSDPNAVFAKLLQDYSNKNSNPGSDLQLGGFPSFDFSGSNLASLDAPVNNGALISSLGPNPKQRFDNITQTLQTNNTNLDQLHNQADGIQNSLSSVESMLQGTPGNLERSGQDFLSQYINCDPVGGNYDYGNMFLVDTPFSSLTSTLPSHNMLDPITSCAAPPLDLNSLSSLNPSIPSQIPTALPYDEDLEEIFTEPPPVQSTNSSMNSPLPAQYDLPN